MKPSILALGRLKAGQMNKTEAEYAEHLQILKNCGEIAWYRFEGMKFRLADNTFYTPDFSVMRSDGVLEMHEVKGYWQDDARVKIEAAKANGKKGGRPKKETQTKASDNPTTNLNETHTKPTGFLLGSEIETQLKAHQTPDTRHHINTNSAATELAVLESADFPAATSDELQKPQKPPGRNIEISVLLRNLGVKPMTGQHPLCIELAQNPKATDDVLKAAVEHARQQKGDGEDIRPNYLKAILPDYLDPKPKKEPSEAWWRSEDGIVRKGHELGMEARSGEGYQEFTTRLHEEIRERKRKGIAA